MMKEVNYLITSEVGCLCPYCGAKEVGFVGDPRGGQFDCLQCGERYIIHNESDIEMEVGV